MIRSAFVAWVAGLLFGAVLFLGGCEEDAATGPEEVSEADRLQAQSEVADAEAYWSSAAVAAEATGGLPDFTDANTSYREALAFDPWNLDANFGAAITEVLALAGDPEIQALMQCLQTYASVDSLLVFEPEFGRLAVPELHRSSTLRSSGRLLFKLVNTSLSCPPLVSDVQNIIQTKLIPAMDYALERMAVIEGVRDFQYVLPPSMTGEPDSLELDLGEVYLLDASLNMAKSLAYMLVAYSLDFDEDGSYDVFEDDVAALRQIKYLLEDSPTFCTLRPGNNMGLAKVPLLTALAKAVDCLTFIRAETDDQTDDLIRQEDIAALDQEIVPGDPEMPGFAQHFDRPEDIIAELREILSGPYTVTEDLDGNPSTPDQVITVNLSALYDNPVQDLRDLLPYHAWEPESQWGAQDTVWYSEYYYEVNPRSPIYLTDAAGNRLEIGLDTFPVFPDYTFGGLFPGMTREQFEALLWPVWGEAPVAKHPAAGALRLPG